MLRDDAKFKTAAAKKREFEERMLERMEKKARRSKEGEAKGNKEEKDEIMKGEPGPP